MSRTSNPLMDGCLIYVVYIALTLIAGILLDSKNQILQLIGTGIFIIFILVWILRLILGTFNDKDGPNHFRDPSDM